MAKKEYPPKDKIQELADEKAKLQKEIADAKALAEKLLAKRDKSKKSEENVNEVTLVEEGKQSGEKIEESGIIGSGRDQMGEDEFADFMSMDKKEDLQSEENIEIKELDNKNNENYEKAKEIVVNSKDTSFSNLARKLKISVNKSRKLLDQLEKEGIVGPANGSLPREFIFGKNKDNNGVSVELKSDQDSKNEILEPEQLVQPENTLSPEKINNSDEVNNNIKDLSEKENGSDQKQKVMEKDFRIGSLVTYDDGEWEVNSINKDTNQILLILKDQNGKEIDEVWVTPDMLNQSRNNPKNEKNNIFNKIFRKDNKLKQSEETLGTSQDTDILSPEKIENLDELLKGIEDNRRDALENGPLSLRFKKGVMDGFGAWENFGQGEEGFKGFAKRFTKMGVNLTLIGLTSSFSVEKFANIGIGTATALSGGVTSYLGRKLAIGGAIGALSELGVKSGKKIPENVKKWLPIVLGVGSITAAVLLSGGIGAGVAAGASWGIGYLASKKLKGGFHTDEKIEKAEEKALNKIKSKYSDENGNVNISKINNLGLEYQKVLKHFENRRIYGKLLDEGVKILVGSAVSAVSMEASGIARDQYLSHHQDTTQTENIKNDKEVVSNEPEVKEEEPIEEEQTDTPVTDNTVENNQNVENNTIENIQKVEENNPVIDNSQQTEGKLDDIMVVHKGEGIEHTFIRQIEGNHELAKELGYKGDLNDAKALHEFAGMQAHIIAIKEGYVDNSGHEVRVAEADKIGYEVKMENGHIIVNEKTIDGNLLETHHEGDKFEENIDKGEYVKEPQEIVTPASGAENHISDTTNGSESTSSNSEWQAPTQENPTLDQSGVQNTDEKVVEDSISDNKDIDVTLNKDVSSNIDVEVISNQEINNIFEHNIHNIFPNEEDNSSWSNIKDKATVAMFAVEKEGRINDLYKPFVSYLHKLEEITGLHPKGSSLFHLTPEKNIEFINRALRKAQELGQLDKVKL